MHRHGYQGRKFHREKDQRRALIKSLAESLIVHKSIETTLPKAQELVPYFEDLITKAKKGGLSNRRQILAKLSTTSSAHMLMDQIAPQLKGRSSGHVRIEKTKLRRGDNAQLARVSFVDDLKDEEPIAEVSPLAVPKAAPKTAKAKEKAAK